MLACFLGDWTSIAKKPYIFVNFQGVSGPLAAPTPLDPRLFTQQLKLYRCRNWQMFYQLKTQDSFLK